MLQARSDIDTTEILENWGRWAGGNAFSSLCYPSIEPFRRLYSLPGETARVRPPLDTDMAERADKVMASLIKRDEQIGVVTALYFMTGMSYSDLAAHLSRRTKENYSRSRVYNIVGIGMAWFDGASEL